MSMKTAFWGLMLLCGCSSSSPPAPAPTSLPAASATPKADFAQVSLGRAEKVSGAPFVGMSRALASLPGASASKGAWVPLMDAAQPDRVVLLKLTALTPEEADKRPGRSLILSGTFKTLDDAALVASIEEKLGAKLLRVQEKPVYLEVSDDPWRGATPKPKETPISGP